MFCERWNTLDPLVKIYSRGDVRMLWYRKHGLQVETFYHS